MGGIVNLKLCNYASCISVFVQYNKAIVLLVLCDLYTVFVTILIIVLNNYIMAMLFILLIDY